MHPLEAEPAAGDAAAQAVDIPGAAQALAGVIDLIRLDTPFPAGHAMDAQHVSARTSLRSEVSCPGYWPGSLGRRENRRKIRRRVILGEVTHASRCKPGIKTGVSDPYRVAGVVPVPTDKWRQRDPYSIPTQAPRQYLA